ATGLAVTLGGPATQPPAVDGRRRHRLRTDLWFRALELRVVAALLARRGDLSRRVLLGRALSELRADRHGDRALRVRPRALWPVRRLGERHRVSRVGGDHRARSALAGAR